MNNCSFACHALQWTLILSVGVQDGSVIVEWFHYSNTSAGGYLPWRGSSAHLLTDWLSRSASQESFYDTHYRSKSTCGPRKTISPAGQLGLPAGLSVAHLPVSLLSADLCSYEVRAGMSLKFMYHQPEWTYLVITHSSNSLMSTILATTQRIC